MLKEIKVKSFKLLNEVSFRHTAYLSKSAVNADKNGIASIPYLNRILAADPGDFYDELVDTYATIKTEHPRTTDAGVTPLIADSFVIWGRMYVIAYFALFYNEFWRNFVLPRMIALQPKQALKAEMRIAAARIDEYYKEKELITKEMMAAEAPTPNETVSNPQNNVTPQKAAIGRPSQQLFYSYQTELQQKDLVLAFLKKHNLSSQNINCENDSTINKYLASIYWRWQDLKFVPAEPLPTAFYKFLAENCKLGFSVAKKSFTNRMGEILKHREKYLGIWGEVTEFFQK